MTDYVKVCPVCGKTFEYIEGRGRRKYCSMACARIGQNTMRLEHYWVGVEESRRKAREWYQIQKGRGQTQWDRMRNVSEFRSRQRGYQNKYCRAHRAEINERNREWARRNPKRKRLLRKIDEYIEKMHEEGRESK